MRPILLAVAAASVLAACTRLVDVAPQRAYAALAAGDYVSAEQLYRDRLAAAPGDPWALFNLAVVYQNTGRVPQARDLYQRLVALNPPDKVGVSTDGRGTGGRLVDLARQNLAALPP